MQYAIVAGLVILLIVTTMRFMAGYKAALGTPREKFMAVFRRSGTILWSRILLYVSVLLAAFPSIAAIFTSSPEIQTALQSIFPPQYTPYYLIAVAIITEYVRRQPTSPAPLPPPPGA